MYTLYMEVERMPIAEYDTVTEARKGLKTGRKDHRRFCENEGRRSAEPPAGA